MPGSPKTIAEINRKPKDGEAVVMTAVEFKNEVRAGRRFTPEDVDVVTTATRGVMSGTSARCAQAPGPTPANKGSPTGSRGAPFQPWLG